MASIPLHCNICPKQPVFSDISHLLTHVGSKGHLSHYFKAQVRGGQDPAARTQLDIYDRWYTENQIEKLLSQRMILKDSKRPNGTTRASSRPKLASQKFSKLSTLGNKKEDAPRPNQLLLEGVPDNAIDPRLSQAPSASAHSAVTSRPSPSLSSPGLDLTSVYRAPIPRMHTFQSSNSKSVPATEFHDQLVAAATLAATEGLKVGSDTESDQEHSKRRSPFNLSYPDPPMIESQSTTTQHEAKVPSLRPAPRGRPRRVHGNKEGEVAEEENFIPKTPELKGICYPGMALFDSANVDDQRKRNQRKNESLIAQIEQDSLEIECNEYIYWPDGSLKMCRFITGDVQSTPLKEDTPPPPPPKRRRGRKSKDKDGATDKKIRKLNKSSRASEHEASHAVKREASLSQTFEWPNQTHTEGNTDTRAFGLTSIGARTEAEEDGWLLNMGDPFLKCSRLNPILPHEDVKVSSQAGDPVKPMANPLRSIPRKRRLGSQGYSSQAWVGESAATSQPHFEVRSKRLPSGTSNAMTKASNIHLRHDEQAKSFAAKHDKENVLPDWDYARSSYERSTSTARANSNHRYTIAKADQKTQVSFTLPAEMAFAGLPTPPVYRVSLNPLNPNAHLRQSLPYSTNYTPFEAPGFPGHSNHEHAIERTRRNARITEDSDETSIERGFMFGGL
ncbi:MAG: hypothetical protein L6R41_002239 [Letrouitia leprolyta]|nr:MAG: hypothetical protein L6R41_002239 [Letrouitia leprolyta]